MLNFNNIEIMVVEDSWTQAEYLKYILEHNKYQVNVAHNGAEALEYLKTSKPAIIISDIMMPVMDGYQLCEKIKSDESLKDISIILLTGLSDPKDVIKGLVCGADNFLTKPFNEDFLLSRIRHILINKELRRNGSSEMGMEVFFEGHKHFLTSERMQIIDLLLSTFQNAVQKNLELEESNNELKKALKQIKILESNYRNLLEKNSDAMVVVDVDGTVCYVNPAAEALFCQTAKELIGKPFIFPVLAGETKEVNITPKGKEIVIAEMRVVETNWEGKNAYLASLRDVTENVRLREKLRNLSLRDELTGLYNRRGFFALAEQQLKVAKRTGEHILLLYADLDSMKWINDNLGHSAGDQALIDATSILKDTIRESDIIARLGGDEFAVMSLVDQGENCDLIKTRLKERLEKHNMAVNRGYNLSISVGMVCCDPDESGSLDELLTLADKQMYEDKRSKVRV